MEWYSQTGKRLPTMRETRVQSLGREDLLEKEMATHPSILAWEILWTEEPGRQQPMGSQRVRHDWVTERLQFFSYTHTHTHTMFLDWKNQYCENDYTTQSNLQIQWNLYQITNGIFHRTKTKSFAIHMETQKTLSSQSSLEKEESSWKNQPSWLQIILQSYSHQDSMVLAQKKEI